MARRALLLLAFSVCACGGKIMPGTEIDAGVDPDTSGSAQSQAPTPSSVDVDPEAACGIVCDRNARCGADKPDCRDDCLADLGGACASQTVTYETCFASRLDDQECASLPPACEQAWCAWAACKGQPLLSYCE
ncbi:MAG TPA: hypothetical protein VIF62_04205 [Labilithrix sp.]|jgi:hypothetical protein